MAGAYSPLLSFSGELDFFLYDSKNNIYYRQKQPPVQATGGYDSEYTALQPYVLSRFRER